ncbi:unnamed protein product [Caenorhabditis sp. 36 PRJEB53466]|nr:unnamed protein product [Caenorhabditis sp. 36 PRJEB53466]
MINRSLLSGVLFFIVNFALAYQKELFETLRFKPSDITKETILKLHNELNDEFYSRNNRESIVQLVYVTPWNNHGYTLAEKTVHKLTHISPVWFQAKPDFQNKELIGCTIEGSHDIDRDWIERLRNKNPKIKIVPRILFDGWGRDEINYLFVNTQSASNCIKAIINFFKRNEFDGGVVEMYMQSLIALQSLEEKELVIETVTALSVSMKKAGLQSILTVPAPLEYNHQPNNLISPEEYKKLIDASDFVQIMTYDYRGQTPKGVAPLDWFEDCLYYLRGGGSKTMLGLNFYGYEFSSRKLNSILADRFLKQLENTQSVLEFDQSSMEHRLQTKSSIIYFPSLTSLELRLNMAHRYGAAIAIWEYGQGLDYFTNLLV